MDINQILNTRIQRLELALSLALDKLIIFESGNSRCVSDDFVAMASVLVNNENDETISLIKKSLTEKQTPPPKVEIT